MHTPDSTPTKTCSKCGREYPATAEYFYILRHAKDGLYPECRTCARESRYAKTVNRTRREGEKRCGHCKQWFPATDEYFDKRAKSVDGLYGWCKSCSNSDREARARSKGVQPKQITRTHDSKRCPKCGEWKPLDRYYSSASPYCIPCESKTHKESRQKRGLPTLKNRRNGNQKQCIHCERWFTADRKNFKPQKRSKDGLSGYCRRCDNELQREFPSKHGENKRRTDRIHLIRRRARKRSLPDSFTAGDWQRALNYFHGCCAACGRPLKDLFGSHTAAADHWIPLSSPDCPGTIPKNIVPLCHGVNGCNNRKGNRDPVEFLETEFGKGKAKQILDRILEYFNRL